MRSRSIWRPSSGSTACASTVWRWITSCRAAASRCAPSRPGRTDRMRALLALLLAVVVTLFATPSTAHAHAMRSGSLSIEEGSDGRALVQLRQSVDGSGVSIVVPAECTSQPVEALSNDRTRTTMVTCGGGDIAGRTFGLRGLGPILEDATLFVRFRDGRTASHLLTKSLP